MPQNTLAHRLWRVIRGLWNFHIKPKLWHLPDPNPPMRPPGPPQTFVPGIGAQIQNDTVRQLHNAALQQQMMSARALQMRMAQLQQQALIHQFPTEIAINVPESIGLPSLFGGISGAVPISAARFVRYRRVN